MAQAASRAPSVLAVAQAAHVDSPSSSAAQVLGKKDFRGLLKWRALIQRDIKAAQKEEEVGVPPCA